MRAPYFQRSFPLGKKIVALIDGRNARNCSVLMVKDFIGNVGCNAEPCHPGYAGSPQVMKPPSGDARQSVKLPFGRAKILERSGS